MPQRKYVLETYHTREATGIWEITIVDLCGSLLSKTSNRLRHLFISRPEFYSYKAKKPCISLKSRICYSQSIDFNVPDYVVVRQDDYYEIFEIE
jgi:hypothetical protein